MDFETLKLSDKDLFESYIDNGLSFENNFATMFVWNAVEGLEYKWAVYENALIVKVMVGGKEIFDIPRTKDENLDKYVEAVLAYCNQNGIPFEMKMLESKIEGLSAETKAKFDFKPIPNQWDYIYTASDLIELKGSKFQKKRNLLSQFVRKYQHTFVDYDRQKHYQQIFDFQEKWRQNVKNDDDNWEIEALKCALDNLEALNLFCDVIEIDGKLSAFSVSSRPSPRSGEVLFEKGDVQYKGIYAAIVNFTAKKHFADAEFINRQEDMGLPNIRRAKLAFNPTMQIKKFMLELKK
ncbi:MAG: phosphatidylglycerol lysyltransferase domain-containing protein [Elusimicrobiota bacterium]|jgi:hypothetical protein|nr:phosphatidylglycerol lysyltransferase domain-containing protein [Elusimicrobiota bacterium]